MSTTVHFSWGLVTVKFVACDSHELHHSLLLVANGWGQQLQSGFCFKIPHPYLWLYYTAHVELTSLFHSCFAVIELYKGLVWIFVCGHTIIHSLCKTDVRWHWLSPNQHRHFWQGTYALNYFSTATGISVEHILHRTCYYTTALIG